MSDSSRDDVRAAIAELGKTTETTNEPAAEPMVVVDGADRAGAVPDEPVDVQPASVAADSGRVRGPDGKFVKGAKPDPKTEAATKPPPPAVATETKAPPVAANATTPPPVAPTTTPTLKAPANWKADMREKFNELPDWAKAEISRTDSEWGKFKGGLETDRSYAQQVRQAVAPFEAMIRAEGGEPVKAIGSLLQTAAALRTGSPESKAHLVAQMIQSYGVPVEMLAKALDGAPARQAPQAVDPNAIAQQAEQRVMAQIQQRMEETTIQSAVQEFEATPREFMGDVEQTMASIVAAARARGEAPSAKLLNDAYDQACWATPSVRAALQQREARKQAETAAAGAAKARSAAVSARPAPTVAPPMESNGTARDDVRAAIAELSGRT